MRDSTFGFIIIGLFAFLFYLDPWGTIANASLFSKSCIGLSFVGAVVINLWLRYGPLGEVTEEQQEKTAKAEEADKATRKQKEKPVVFNIDSIIITYRLANPYDTSHSDIQSKLSTILRANPHADIRHYESVLNFSIVKIERPPEPPKPSKPSGPRWSVGSSTNE